MITQEVVPIETGSLAKDPDQLECPICASPRPARWITAPDRFNGREKPYQLLRCSKCSLVWLHNPPAPAEMGDHYGADYDRTISSAAQSSAHWIPRRDELCRLKSGGAVLDLGCSTGGFLSTLKGPSWKLFGIEMSEDAAKVARSRCGAEVFVGDILDAHFAPASFDAITCFNVFEHVYAPREVLAKIAEWLKPGGIFYTMMPNIDSAGARIFRTYWYALELPRHLFHFSPSTLKLVSQSVGLKQTLLSTHRELYFEASVHYIFDDVLKKFGISRPPLAKSRTYGVAYRFVRKIFRLTLLPLFSAAAALAGDGETITAVFTKGDSSQQH